MSQAYEFKKLTDVETVNGFQEGDEIYIVRENEIKRLANPKFENENFYITLDLDSLNFETILSHELFENVDNVYKNKGNFFVEFYNRDTEVLTRILINEIVKMPPEIVKERFDKEIQCYFFIFYSDFLGDNYTLIVPESEISFE